MSRLRELGLQALPTVVPRCQLYWEKPRQDKVKLNIDGCSRGNPGRSGVGGVIWNA